jgi:small-conductance mechanosensitive channel
VDVVYYLFTVVMAIIVALGGLYIMGDWMLLGLSLVVLTGIVWAGKQSVAVFFEQVKLMLNLGSTREGERIIYNGIPWTVDTIQLYCDLVNPQLKGGHLRLPLRDVVALVSREADPDEYLFPCNEGEWIILSDGIFGKVIQQTPEWVQLVLLGGSRMNYATSEFIGLTPRNLSTGFRLQVLFGVDYQHQKDSTEEIPNKMRLSVEKGLLETVKEGELVHLRVELAEAAASSLNYAIIADFSGKAAPQYNMLERAIQRMCVEACNSHGWTIPFTQVTVHQAESPSQLNK